MEVAEDVRVLVGEEVAVDVNVDVGDDVGVVVVVGDVVRVEVNEDVADVVCEVVSVNVPVLVPVEDGVDDAVVDGDDVCDDVCDDVAVLVAVEVAVDVPELVAVVVGDDVTVVVGEVTSHAANCPPAWYESATSFTPASTLSHVSAGVVRYPSELHPSLPASPNENAAVNLFTACAVLQPLALSTNTSSPVSVVVHAKAPGPPASGKQSPTSSFKRRTCMSQVASEATETNAVGIPEYAMHTFDCTHFFQLHTSA